MLVVRCYWREGWNKHAITSYKSSEREGLAEVGEVSYCISLVHRMFLVQTSLPITLLNYEFSLRHTHICWVICA